MKALKTKGLKITYPDGSSVTKYIYKGKTWTPFQFCVDHGEYYEIANWSSYTRICKKTMQVTSNLKAKDADQFLPEADTTAEIIKLEVA